MDWSTTLTWAALVVGGVVLYGFHPLKRWAYRHIPGPPPSWLFGNSSKYFDRGRTKVLQEAARRYGRVFKVWIGAAPKVVVSDAELGRLVLLRNTTRTEAGGPRLMTFNKAQLKRYTSGLFPTQNAALHKSLKHAWMPAMNSQSLADNARIMEESAQRLVSLLEEVAAVGRPINIWRQYGRMTLEVVGEAAFGVAFHTQDKGASDDAFAQELVSSVEDVFRFTGIGSSKYSTYIVTIPELKPLWIALSLLFPDEALTRTRKAFGNVDRLTDKLIADAHTKAKDVHMDASAAKPPAGSKKPRGIKPGSFPTQMVSAIDPDTHKPLEDIVAAAQTTTFLLAGDRRPVCLASADQQCNARHPGARGSLQDCQVSQPGR